MTLARRRILFYALLLLFLTAGSFLIGRALGITWDISSGGLSHSGGIFIKSQTPRLSLFLDGGFMRQTSFFSGGALLTDLEPGMHIIRIEKEGYTPWSKAVGVEALFVVGFRNVLLVPNPAVHATTTAAEIEAIRRAKESGQFGTAPPPDPSPSPLPNTPLYRIDKAGTLVRSDDATTTPLASHVHSFAAFEDEIYFITETGFLSVLNDASGEIRTIGRPGFYLEKKPVRFARTNTGDLVIRDASGGLFLGPPQGDIKTVTGAVGAFAFDQREEKLLIKQDDTMQILWLGDNAQEPFQKRGDRELLFRSPSPIEQAMWFFGSNAHVVFNTAEGVFFMEIDGRGGINTVELIAGPVDDIMTVKDFPSAVFYKKGAAWHTITIM